MESRDILIGHAIEYLSSHSAAAWDGVLLKNAKPPRNLFRSRSQQKKRIQARQQGHAKRRGVRL